MMISIFPFSPCWTWSSPARTVDFWLLRLGKLLGELAEDTHHSPKRVTGICGHHSDVIDDRSGTAHETYELLARGDRVQGGLFAAHKKKASKVSTVGSKQR